jgi:hypothetical protein
MKLSLLSLVFFTIIAFSCSSDIKEPENLPERIDFLIEQNRYEDALTLLQGEDRDGEEILLMLEKTHLNYGLHSMNTFDQTEMRTRMNNALIQFTKVLKINPQNDVARTQIVQIMDIYSTIPNREPEPHVLEGLRSVGFNY